MNKPGKWNPTSHSNVSFIDVKLVYNTCIIIARNNVRVDSVVIADTDRRALRIHFRIARVLEKKAK